MISQKRLLENQRDAWIIHYLARINDKEKLDELLRLNVIAGQINWLNTLDQLVEAVNSWSDSKIVQFPSGTGSKDFILKYFKLKNKPINSGSLNNACTRKGYR